jgi:hypothetical protein
MVIMPSRQVRGRKGLKRCTMTSKNNPPGDVPEMRRFENLDRFLEKGKTDNG